MYILILFIFLSPYPFSSFSAFLLVYSHEAMFQISYDHVEVSVWSVRSRLRKLLLVQCVTRLQPPKYVENRPTGLLVPN